MMLAVGDLHFKDRLSYSDYVEDGREKERNEILDFIVEQGKDCSAVVLMGDNLNSRTNSPHVIKAFTNFVERFDCEVFILKGNHEAFGDGRSAIDYLKEVKGKKWHIITDAVETHGDIVYCPFFTKAELGTNDNDHARDEILKRLEPGSILFHHHAVSEAMVGAVSADVFPEPILPRATLERKYKLVVGGHIHNNQVKNRTIVTGSTFTNEVGELEKFVWKIDEKTYGYEQIKLPCRPIYKVEISEGETSPLVDLEKNSIVKAVVKKKLNATEMAHLKKELKQFDAYVILEQLPRERTKLHYGEGEGLLEFDIEKLLEVYAKERNVDIGLLKKGFELVRA